MLYQHSSFRSFLVWYNSRKWKYSAISNPYKIIWIDPDQIKYITGRDPYPGRFQWQQIGRIAKGNWDRSTEKFCDLLLYQAMEERYQNGVDWSETEFINRLNDNIAEGKPTWKNVSSRSDIERGCEKVDRIYDNIRTEGYKTVPVLIRSGVIDPEKRVVPEEMVQHDEIAVDIGRNGQFLFVDGRHRLAIAKILNLEEIPVRVSARHAEWQKIRDRVERANSPEELPESVRTYLDHPDLADVAETIEQKEEEEEE